jgi:hypothetical protein
VLSLQRGSVQGSAKDCGKWYPRVPCQSNAAAIARCSAIPVESEVNRYNQNVSTRRITGKDAGICSLSKSQSLLRVIHSSTNHVVRPHSIPALDPSAALALPTLTVPSPYVRLQS